MGKKSTSINLVKKTNNQLVNQVINWTLTIGRVLVIIVEIIALSAFIYRFYLDNQLRDVTSKIRQEQEILNSQKQKEAEYRNLQERLNLEAETVNQGKEKTAVFKDILNLTPPGVNYTTFELKENQLTIDLNTNSVFPLSVFINSLKNYKLTDYISINNIESKTSSAVIEVGLTINLKTKGGMNNVGN